MSESEQTQLFKRSIGLQRDNDVLERFRSSLQSVQRRTAWLAGEIDRDLPDFTVHDATHIDALWETADLIAGSEFTLTPLEGYLFGVAVCLHDAGMGLAAYPAGKAALRSDPRWTDAVAGEFSRVHGRMPTHAEVQAPSFEVERPALAEVLRALHAERAGMLGVTSWRSGSGPEEYLIEDAEFRRAYGELVGLIAASHHWDISDLSKRLVASVGAPPGAPNEWNADPVKVACLLRVADAAHLDSRRAPPFLRALRQPSGDSDLHWEFQSRLQQPRLIDGRLEFSSPSRFPIEQSDAWWLCWETLRTVDREMRSTDALLADTHRPRFAARGVAGADDPERLTRTIATDRWVPVDTSLRVSDVAGLVRRLGGQELYGEDPVVALRELIQNGSDAVRARRLLEGRSGGWGEVTVALDKVGAEWALSVSDSGIGMSRAALTGPFLDFGTSYWGTPLMRREHPGLLAKGFQSTGKFGIGFFSVFMLGERVKVTTRSVTDAPDGTRILEFSPTTFGRPVLSPNPPKGRGWWGQR